MIRVRGTQYTVKRGIEYLTQNVALLGPFYSSRDTENDNCTRTTPPESTPQSTTTNEEEDRAESDCGSECSLDATRLSNTPALEDSPPGLERSPVTGSAGESASNSPGAGTTNSPVTPSGDRGGSSHYCLHRNPAPSSHLRDYHW